jgi:signal transduction histidine kinase
MFRWARAATINLAAEAGLAFLASVAFFVLAAAAIPVRDDLVVILPLGAVYLYVVLAAAKRLGPLYGVPLGLAAGLALDSFYIPPTREFGAADWQNWLVIAIYLLLGTLIGLLGARAQRRAESSERAGGAIADEQAALRRVATLVARGASPEKLFAAVAEELGRLLGVHATHILRFDPDGNSTSVGSWSTDSRHLSVGTRHSLDSTSLMGLVFRTGGPARIDDYDGVSDQVSAMSERLSIRSAVGAPIVVEGQLWGVMTASSDEPQPLAAGTESRIAGFTGLVATAISNTEARVEVGRLAEEQAALRRVATLVAREAPPEEVFAKVAEEVGLLLGAESAWMYCFEPDGAATVVASCGQLARAFPVGMRLGLEGENVTRTVLRTGRPARIDDYAKATGSLGTYARELGIRSGVGSPIFVEGRLWGVMGAASLQSKPLPVGSESRTEEFTELVATAISNMQARSDLAASRARIVAATDEERRRVVRDLHDGAQQRLVHTVVTLKMARRALEDEGEAVPVLVTEALENAEAATGELRELAHGILPSVLTRGGLRAGVVALASRTPMPVDFDVGVDRFPPAVEATAYFVVAEALTNVAKHSRAHRAAVMARVEKGTLQVEIQDDGVGGAERDGSGFLGLADRLAVLDGTLRVESPPDGGTLVAAAIPLPWTATVDRERLERGA